MDALRRGALMRMGKIVAGAAGAAALSGSRGEQISSPKSVNFARGSYSSGDVGCANVPDIDPSWEKRSAAARPLQAKIGEIYRSRRWSIGDSAYLNEMKSPREWWKRSVMMDRERRRETAIETLQSQIDKLMQSPMDKLEQMANEALASFMAEWNKP